MKTPITTLITTLIFFCARQINLVEKIDEWQDHINEGYAFRWIYKQLRSCKTSEQVDIVEQLVWSFLLSRYPNISRMRIKDLRDDILIHRCAIIANGENYLTDAKH